MYSHLHEGFRAMLLAIGILPVLAVNLGREYYFQIKNTTVGFNFEIFYFSAGKVEIFHI